MKLKRLGNLLVTWLIAVMIILMAIAYIISLGDAAEYAKLQAMENKEEILHLVNKT